MPIKITSDTKYPPAIAKAAHLCAVKHQDTLDKWGHYTIVSIHLEKSNNPLYQWNISLFCTGWDTRTIEDTL